MKWVTREKAKVDRIACPWLITKFIDPDPEFVFLPHDANWSAITDGTVFDVPNAELGHHGEYCSFDAIVARYGLEKDLALVLPLLCEAAESAMDTSAIERLTGAKGALDEKEGVFKVSVPRKDLSVIIAGVKMTPSMGLTSWAAFKRDGKDDMVMGDLVLTEDQISPVIERNARQRPRSHGASQSLRLGLTEDNVHAYRRDMSRAGAGDRHRKGVRDDQGDQRKDKPA
jgi:hypothetical protein